MKRYFDFVFWNTLFAGLLYLEVIMKIPQAGWVLNFWIVFSGVVMAIMLFMPEEKIAEIDKKPYHPFLAQCDWLYDVAFMVALIWFAKFWMAGFYFFVLIGSAHLQRLRKERI